MKIIGTSFSTNLFLTSSKFFNQNRGNEGGGKPPQASSYQKLPENPFRLLYVGEVPSPFEPPQFNPLKVNVEPVKVDIQRAPAAEISLFTADEMEEIHGEIGDLLVGPQDLLDAGPTQVVKVEEVSTPISNPDLEEPAHRDYAEGGFPAGDTNVQVQTPTLKGFTLEELKAKDSVVGQPEGAPVIHRLNTEGLADVKRLHSSPTPKNYVLDDPYLDDDSEDRQKRDHTVIRLAPPRLGINSPTSSPSKPDPQKP